MAYATISKPSLYFNTLTYGGNDASGRAITGVGFQPDWCWFKDRSNSVNHSIFDSVRGATKNIVSNTNAAESTSAQGLQAFGTDGFTLGSDGDVNGNNNNYASWNWKAGTTSGLSGGNITPSAYSYNATSGFGIYKYTGNGSADQTIPHGLGKKPQIIFYKRLDSSTNWVVQSNLLGNRVQLVLNDNSTQNTDSRLGNLDSWSNSVFSLGTYGDMNASGSSHVAYCFAEKRGYSRFATYTGNNNANGPYIYTGFKPAFIIIKESSNSRDWIMVDNKRNPNNVVSNRLFPNGNSAQNTNNDMLDFYSNGFKIRNTNTTANNNSGTYIYMAFAENPLVDSTGKIPATAK